MPEQQQDGDGGQRTHSNVLVVNKPTSISKLSTKRYKKKHHRRRYNKYPSSYTPLLLAIEEAPALETSVAQPSPTEEMQETSIAIAEWDVETDPAVPALAKKTPINEIVVPETPPTIEEVYTLAVGKTLKGGQGHPQGDAPPIRELTSYTRSSYGRGIPLRVPWLIKHTIFRVNPAHAVASLRTSWRIILTYALLTLLLINTLLLWQDLTATHLYVSTLDANNGSIHSRQDLIGYRKSVRLTTPIPVNNHPGLAVLGAYTHEPDGTQQLLTLQNTRSSIELQRSVSLANGAIAQDIYGRLLVESADGLQVVMQDGRVAWHIQGQQPTHGVHPFTPVSDTGAVYTVASVTHRQIAAYALTNGQMRWTQTLPDTLEYAPPFVIDADTLYIASDHSVFALNRGDGSVRWEKPYAARTLLIENEGQQHLLLALSSQGIQALQSDTGKLTWSFRGEPTISTVPTQFYQGALGYTSATTSNTLYATGVVWHIPNVREDVWLYALDATTGIMRWSQQIASGPTGVDTGRVFQPLLNTDNSMVIVQRAISKHEDAVTAYDTSTGTQRWNTAITDMNTSSPTVFQIASHTFAVFTTTTNSPKIFWTPSFYRTCVLLFLLVSIVGLLSLMFLPKEQGRRRIQRVIETFVGIGSSRPAGVSIAKKDAMNRSLQTYPQHFVKPIHLINVSLKAFRRRWKHTYTAFALALLCICIGISIFASIRSHQPARQLLTNDAQGSVVITNTDDTLHQLEAFKPDGTRQWMLFSSEGAFSMPKAQTQAGTLLVALRGDTAHTYVVAGDDPAYPRPLDSMLALYLLDRSTGHVLWQQIVSYPDEQQDSGVIGVDTTYIYVASEHTVTLSTQFNTESVKVPQLFAVNKLTGMVDWRIFGPTQLANKQPMASTLLIQNGQVFWHVANTIFTIDANVGQIIGRR